MNRDIIKDVEKVLREQDPLDLIAGGAPEDEYEGEASLIARKLQENPVKESLKDFITDLAKNHFEVSLSEEKLNSLMNKLLEIKEVSCMLVDHLLKKEALTLAQNTASVFDIELDFSNSSIKKVEKILSKFSESYKVNPKEKEASKIAFSFASYIIEVVERNFPDKKGEWKIDDLEFGKETYPYIFSDGSVMFPVAWCMKRIIDGKSEDVWFKYQALILEKIQ